jgi:hypothetical protein
MSADPTERAALKGRIEDALQDFTDSQCALARRTVPDLDRYAEELSETTRDRQVALHDLGFCVDEGLEDLIRACWRRNVPTWWTSCIGTGNPDDDHGGDAHIGFGDPFVAARW